ncbi:hypothetical protein V6N12_066574 [Hibiscus sabdariffa]|uniref:EXS domain-containing protein n=1 Tax=Hibiscus sabdariffa TaxID=183260 RepID=A0ABR2CR18_9ROSI
MFGSPPAIAYFHSPHLRKPGAKSAGTDEPGNGAEMKGTNPHLYIPAIMPSPVFLWRFKCSIWMTIIVPTSMTTYLYLYSHGEVSLAASQPPISFPDFFLADILTSMAKVFSDLERSACRMVHHQVATIAWLEADSVCGSHSAAIPLVLVIPYTWRLMQCLRQYMDTKEKTILLNGLFLGDRKRPDLAVYVDVQTVCSSPPQLLDSVYDYHLRDAQKVSMDILSD